MDGCSSWLPFHGHGDGTDGTSDGLHEEQDEAISLQLQQQLKQIYALMDFDKDRDAEPVPTSSLSAFPSSGSGSPDDVNLANMIIGSTITTTSSHQPVVVSSLQVPSTTADDHHVLFHGNNLDDAIVNLDDLMTHEPHQEQVQNKNGHEFGGAFRPYVCHLSPRKMPKPGACGQRAIKAAMSAMARMHKDRLAQWQSYRMEIAAPLSVGSNSVQIQHVLSERKRREKLNDNFKTLRTVLPPGPKKDRASTLIGARDYVNTLKSRVSELEEKNRMLLEEKNRMLQEEKNRMLVESQLHGDNGSEQDDNSSEQIDVEITKAAAEETSQEFRLKIDVGPGWNAMDAVVTILQCLKEIKDIRVCLVGGMKRDGTASSRDSLILEAFGSEIRRIEI